MADSIAPQFRITLPCDGEGRTACWGTQVTFDGQQIRNFVSVKAENTAEVDDLVRSTITIELVGEPIIVEVAGGHPKV